jgi:hypothetical protein
MAIPTESIACDPPLVRARDAVYLAALLPWSGAAGRIHLFASPRRAPTRCPPEHGRCMEAFPYLTTFIALVPALALARVLSGLADLIQHGLSGTPGTVRWSGLFVVLAVGITTATAWEWWLLFNWRDEARLTFFWFQFLLIKPSLLLVIARLLIPDIQPGTDIDLDDHYFVVAPSVFPLFAIVPLFDLPAAHLGVITALGPAAVVPYSVLIVIWSALCASLAAIRRRWWHWLVLFLLNAIVFAGQLAFGMNLLN